MLSGLRTFLGMKGFFIKKAFFDGWDNLIGIVLFNLAYIALLMAGLYAALLAGEVNAAAAAGATALSLALVSIVMGGTAAVTHSYSDYRRDSWHAFISGIRRNIGHSLLFSLILIVAVFNIRLIIPFYLSYGNAFGYVLALVMIWLEVIIVLAVPYYFPLMNLLPADRPVKTAKKCLLIAGDNMGFSLFFLLYSLVLAVLSLFTMGLIPGVTGIQLAAQDAMKLLMMKYDYLEGNPDADRKHIPWEDVLYDEKEKIGPRSLKSMIFPWKY